jgi:hypothetical protein
MKHNFAPRALSKHRWCTACGSTIDLQNNRRIVFIKLGDHTRTKIYDMPDDCEEALAKIGVINACPWLDDDTQMDKTK